MRAHAACEAEEVVHLRAGKDCSGRGFVFGDIDIGHDDSAVGVDKVTVEVGAVPHVLLDHLEFPRGRGVAGIASGEGGDSREGGTFVKVGLLVAEVDGDAGRS